MGGYNPNHEGYIKGKIDGLFSDSKPLRSDSLTYQGSEFTHQLYTSGYADGYVAGQAIMKLLYDTVTPLPFEEKRKLYHFLISQKISVFCKEEDRDVFLRYQDLWGIGTINIIVAEESLSLLLEGKTQRSLQCISEYYKSNFYLQAYRDILEFVHTLRDIRGIKKKKQLSVENYIIKKKQLESQVYDWLIKYKSG